MYGFLLQVDITVHDGTFAIFISFFLFVLPSLFASGAKVDLFMFEAWCYWGLDVLLYMSKFSMVIHPLLLIIIGGDARSVPARAGPLVSVKKWVV